MLDFEHSLPMLLLRARERTMARFRPILSAHGLTEQQWRILRALWEEDGLEIRRLVARTLILSPSMTGIIDRLERDELVERRADSNDGRKTCIWMTRKAKRLYERIRPLVEREYRNLQQRFTKKKWDELYSALFHLIRINGEQPGDV